LGVILTVIVDPPWYLTLLLEIGSGAIVAVGLYLFFVWRDRNR
jgi:hypothetical protein